MSVDRPDPATTADRTVVKLFGVLLMVVGGLVAVLSGLCSAAVMVAGLANGFHAQLLAALLLPAVFGGVPFLAGAGVFWIGRSLWRGPQPTAIQRPDQPKP